MKDIYVSGINFDSKTEEHIVFLGRVGEGDMRRIRFDVSSVLSEFPGATFEITITPPKSTTPYLVVATLGERFLSFDVGYGDTSVSGTGTLIVRVYNDTGLLKSATMKTKIEPSQGDETGEAPAGVQSWVDAVVAAKNEAVAAKEAAEAAYDQLATAEFQDLAEEYSAELNSIDLQLAANAQKMSIVTMLSDYALTGDGVADDTTALLQSFSDAVTNQTTLYLEPNRTYLVKQRIQLTGIKSLVVEGNNASIVFKDIADSITGMLSIKGDGTGIIKINNLTVVNENAVLNAVDDASTGQLFNVHIADFAKAIIDNVNSYKAYKVGIQLSNLKSGSIKHCTVERSNYAGIRLQGCENFTIEKNKVSEIYVNADTDIGYGIACTVSGAYSYGTFGDNKNISILDNRVYNCGRKNIDAHNSLGIIVEKNQCYNASTFGGMARTKVYALIYIASESDAGKNTKNAIVKDNILENEAYTVANNSSGAGIRVGAYNTGKPFGTIIISGNMCKNVHYWRSIWIDSASLVDSVIIEGNTILSDSTRYTYSAITNTASGVEIPQFVVNNNTININTGKVLELSNIATLISTGNSFIDVGSQSTNAILYKLTTIAAFKRSNVEKMLGTTTRDSFTSVTEV